MCVCPSHTFSLGRSDRAAVRAHRPPGFDVLLVHAVTSPSHCAAAVDPSVSTPVGHGGNPTTEWGSLPETHNNER